MAKRKKRRISYGNGDEKKGRCPKENRQRTLVYKDEFWSSKWQCKTCGYKFKVRQMGE